MCCSLPRFYWHSHNKKATIGPDGFWGRDNEPVLQQPATPPRRPEVQPTTPNSGDQTRLEIIFPSWMVDLSDISISISPRRGTTQASDRRSTTQASDITQRHVTPIVTTAHRHRDTSAPDAQTPSSAPRPGPSDRPLHQDRSRTSTATQPETSLPAQSSQVSAAPPQSQLHHPRPIYPLQPGEPTPPVRIFRDDRAHGYYIIFKGPCLGIYHEYWFVCCLILRIDNLLIYIHMQVRYPAISSKGSGWFFQEGCHI